jgi:hypothetical protein
MNNFTISLNPSIKIRWWYQNFAFLKVILFIDTPLTFSSWNQIIKDMRNIYKLKDLINLPVSVINPI